MDYRALNKITIPDKFLILGIDQLLDELGAAVVFSKLDLKSSYHQIGIKPGDEAKHHSGHEGHYKFMIISFGLTITLSAFQFLMNGVFKEYLRKFILAFFYDILIYSLDFSTHLNHLMVTLRILKNQLVINLKKCIFGECKLEYLGRIISTARVQADPAKIESMV